MYCFIPRNETDNLIIDKIILVTKFVYLLLIVTNYIDFIFSVILLHIYRILLLNTLILYCIALYLILNLLAYI